MNSEVPSDKSFFDTQFCFGESYRVNDTDLVINGTLKGISGVNEIKYIASAPANYRTSFPGSGLPFPSAHTAINDTMNKGTTSVGASGNFTIKIKYPNSYYTGLGTVKVPPTVYCKYNVNGQEKNFQITLGEGIPYRRLTYPIEKRPRNSATFYEDGWKMPVRTQEQILKDSGYPIYNKESDTFWGLKPPN